MICLDVLPWSCPGQRWVDSCPASEPIYSFGKAEVLWGLRNFLDARRPEHQSSIDCLKERGVEERSSRHSTTPTPSLPPPPLPPPPPSLPPPPRRERSVFHQTNRNAASRATLGTAGSGWRGGGGWRGC